MELDYLTIIAATCAGFALLGLAWLGGYDLGQAQSRDTERRLAHHERAIADRRMKGLLDELNKMKAIAAKKRRASK
jgi:hypothetical protein